MTTIGNQINTPMARTFRQIVTGGWATKSDGNVEAPTGHFALVLIEPGEVAELREAFDTEFEDEATPFPGAYIVHQDNDGNTELIEFLSASGAKKAYNMAAREYALWDAECPRCKSHGPHEQVAALHSALQCPDCKKVWRWSADEIAL